MELAGRSPRVIAEQWVGCRYLVGSLEGTGEQLRYRFDGFDCFTLVESALVLHHLSPEDSPQQFEVELQQWRYREGELKGYGSRLHYTLEWLVQAVARGKLKDITPTIPGHQCGQKPIHFMSSHVKGYRGLSDPEALRLVQEAEVRLSQTTFCQMDLETLSDHLGCLLDGDVLILYSCVPGLDVAHLGLVAQGKGPQPGFLHASSKSRAVCWETNLLDYLKKYPKLSGVGVFRSEKSLANEPK
jgi:hypothetical protein